MAEIWEQRLPLMKAPWNTSFEMFFLGHMGLGSKLVSPFSQGLRKRDVLIGAIVPDIVDKSLYYSLFFLTGKKGAELGLICGTRTFGHTGIFLLVVAIAATLRKSKFLAAFTLGIASHLFLDNLMEAIYGNNPMITGISALFWPWTKFPVFPYRGIADHLASIFQPYIFWGEVSGAAILAWDYWKSQYQKKYPTQLRRWR